MADTKEKGDEFPKFSETASGRMKTGRLRDLFDEIEAAKVAGWRYEWILLGLKAQGLEVSMNTLKNALKRIRAERRSDAAKSRPAPKKEPVQAAAINAGKPDLKSKNHLSPEGFRDPAPGSSGISIGASIWTRSKGRIVDRMRSLG